MADVKISGLPAAAAVSGTQEFEVNESGTSKKVTGAQLAAYVEGTLGTLAGQDADSVTISGGSITGITDLALADGGTGASTAQGARTNILPSQTGNNGKALVTNGTDVSFEAIGIADGDKGDITVSSSGAVWTIDNNAITTAKITDGNVTGAKLENSGVTANSYGSGSQIPVLTIDAKGRITSASTATVAAGGGGFSNMQVFTSSGTFTVPAGITKVKVTVVGGGGGGGSFNSGRYNGGGGGGAAIEVISGLTGGSTVSVTVGAGGAYNNTGGTSSFGGYCSATGGSPTGAGGLGSGGQLNIKGGGGNYGYTEPYSGDYGEKGGGGSSILGGGAPATGSFGSAGGAYGGGGSSQSVGSNGFAGAAGVVIVEY